MRSAEEMLVDRIYEAGLVPTLWPQILADFTHRFGGVGTVFIASGATGHQMSFSPGFDKVMAGFVEEGWSTRNQRLARATARRLDGFLAECDLFTEEELLADPMLAGFLLPRGIGREFGTVIALPTGDTIALTVQRRFDAEPVSTSSFTLANALRPHLSRAILLSARLGLERARAAAEALRVVGLPAAVLATGGRPLAMNALFEGLMPSLAVERHRRISLSEPRAKALLAEALDRHGENGARSIPLRATAISGPAIAHVIPVRGSAHDIFVGAAHILVITPVINRRNVEGPVLEGLFDLTPAEVRLCSAIAEGRSTLPEVALALGLSYHTAKTQLRSVFEKTGTLRQGELVGLLSALAL